MVRAFDLPFLRGCLSARFGPAGGARWARKARPGVLAQWQWPAAGSSPLAASARGAGRAPSVGPHAFCSCAAPRRAPGPLVAAALG